MRKSVAAAVMAASLTVGGAAGATLFVPSVSGAEEDTDRPERGDFLADALAPLVEDRTIDQSQADAVIAAIEEVRPGGFGHRGPDGFAHAGFPGEIIADVLGISAEDVRTALADGQTIGEIAEAHGVSADEVVDAFVAGAEEWFDAAVADGRLSEDEAADKLADLTERATEVVDRVFEPGDHRHGPHGGSDGTPGS